MFLFLSTVTACTFVKNFLCFALLVFIYLAN